MTIAKAIRTNLARVKNVPKRTALLLRHRLIPFLQPYWDAEELELGQKPTDDQSSAEAGPQLEQAFLDLLNVEGIATATGSGRTALALALRALKARRPARNEVIIPSYGCRGMLDPILEVGLKPRFADVGPDLNVNAETLQPHLNEQTLAVVPAHLGGKRIESFETVLTMAERVGAVVIEDVCQALGGVTAGHCWGSTAPMSFFSFAVGKNVMATAGGMLVARDFIDQVREERTRLTDQDPQRVGKRFAAMRRLLNTSRRVVQPSVHLPAEAFREAHGFRRISPLDARLVLCQLGKLEAILKGRSKNATVLVDCLQGLGELDVPGAGGVNVWTKFSVAAASETSAKNIRRRLYKAGIETEETYSPLHQRECGRPYASGPLPAVEAIYPRVFNLPVRPSLTEPQVQFIADTLRKTVEQIGQRKGSP